MGARAPAAERMNLLDTQRSAGALPAELVRRDRRPASDPSRHLAGDLRADVCVVGGGYTGLSAALASCAGGARRRPARGAAGRVRRVGPQRRSGRDRPAPAPGRARGNVGDGSARRLWDSLRRGEGTGSRRSPMRPEVDAAWQDGVVAGDTFARASRAKRRPMRNAGPRLWRRSDRDTRPSRACQRSSGPRPSRRRGRLVDGPPAPSAPGPRPRPTAPRPRARGLHEDAWPWRSTARRVRDGATGHVRADHVVLAANGYLGRLAPDVGKRVMPINNFVVATEPSARAEMPLARAGRRGRRPVRGELLAADGGRPAALRRRRELRLPLPARHRRRRCAADAGGVYRGCADVDDHPRLGRNTGDNPQPDAVFRAAPPRRLVGLRLFRPRRGDGGHGRAGSCGGDRQARRDASTCWPRSRRRTFPGGTAARSPVLALAMTWYALRDRLGL